MIAIEGIKFYGSHGYHMEEASMATRFTFDIYVKYNVEKAGKEDDLSATVDYQCLYEICKEVMSTRAQLLERLAVNVASKIRERYPDSGAIRVRVSKWHPPVGGELDRSFVEYVLD